MDEETLEAAAPKPVGKVTLKSRAKRYARITILVAEYIFDEIADATVDSVRVIQREGRLFLGTMLTVIGLMNYSNGKYCDGNVADYLSCTRPTVYYYYGAFETFLVVMGVVLILVWLLKRSRREPPLL